MRIRDIVNDVNHDDDGDDDSMILIRSRTSSRKDILQSTLTRLTPFFCSSSTVLVVLLHHGQLSIDHFRGCCQLGSSRTSHPTSRTLDVGSGEFRRRINNFTISVTLSNNDYVPFSLLQFSPSLLHQLTSSSNSDSSSPSSSSSANHHDPIILSRLQAEVTRLRNEESQILSSISSALEKENLDREKPSNKDSPNPPSSLNSVVLSRDLEEVRDKVERMMNKSQQYTAGEESQVKSNRESLVQCYL